MAIAGFRPDGEVSDVNASAWSSVSTHDFDWATLVAVGASPSPIRDLDAKHDISILNRNRAL